MAGVNSACPLRVATVYPKDSSMSGESPYDWPYLGGDCVSGIPSKYVPYRLARGRFSKLDYSIANYEQVVFMYKTDEVFNLNYNAYIVKYQPGSYSVTKLGTINDPYYMEAAVFLFDLAAADMDQVSDDDGFLNDEIVMARVYRNGEDDVTTLWISILDGGLNEMVFFYIPGGIYHRLTEAMSLAIGDFNGDGSYELAVGLRMQDGATPIVQIMLFEVDNSGDEMKIVQAATKEYTHGARDIFGGKGIELEAGDFNGDGKDDLVVANSNGVMAIDVDKPKDTWEFFDKGDFASMHFSPDYPPALVSGLFKFDPAEGFSMNRLQVIKCGLTYEKKAVDCMMYIYNEDLGAYSTQEVISSEPLGGKTWAGLQPIVTSGNLYGHGFPDEKEERTDPKDQIIVSYLMTNKSGSFFYPTWLGIDPAVPEVMFRWQDTEEFGDLWGPVAALLYDADGDSYTLGDPVHMVFSNHLSLSALIQEPPKHVDYLPVDASLPDGEWD
ncbi:MAG: FG-GAP repeat protein, partial [Deltaproteobacteria bacterium]|nr:FG-GAP repeat protein [Deltaproteobacteria bacterium]